MTKKKREQLAIDSISRSWVGHIASNPELREQVNEILLLRRGANAKLADLINKTVGPKKKVKAEDVRKIKKRVNEMFAPGDQPKGARISNITHVGPDPWDD
jgi:hypothetical protein